MNPLAISCELSILVRSMNSLEQELGVDPVRKYDRRKIAIGAALRLMCVAVGAGGAILIALLAYQVSVDANSPISLNQWIQERILGFFKGAGSLLSPVLVRRLAEEFPYQIIALVGGAAGLVRSNAISKWAYTRFFDVMDPRVLSAIPAPREHGEEGPGALCWIEPAGLRLDRWRQLHGWAVGAIESERFSWCVLVGRPGAGKTRAAHELARQLVSGRFDARIDVPDRSTVVGRLREIGRGRAAYLRSLVGRARAADPWDAGELHRTIRGSQPLTNWRPRRPTLLILDDPRPMEASQTVKALLDRVAVDALPNPVRLLIVDQAIPADLAMYREEPGWVSEYAGVRPPIDFSDDTYFTVDEVAYAAKQVLGPPGATALEPHGLAELVEVTGGNPLLVELGLLWIKAGHPLERMSSSALLASRAARVVEALEQAGISDAAMRAVAAATVCGGAPRNSFETVFGVLPRTRRLHGAFPLEKEWLRSGGLPPVHPELIGDEFVRAIVDNSAATAAQIVDAAWLANPMGTLRTAHRLGSAEDVLGEVLKAGPPADWPGSRVDLVRAYVEHYVRYGGDFSPVDRVLTYLVPAEAEAELAVFAALLSARGARADGGIVCFARALERVLSEPQRLTTPAKIAAVVETAADAVRWGSQRGYSDEADRSRVGRIFEQFLARVSDIEAPAESDLTSALMNLEAAVWQAEPLQRDLGRPVFDACAKVFQANPIDRELVRIRALSASGNSDEALALAEQFHADYANDERWGAVVAKAWGSAVWGVIANPSTERGRAAERIAHRVAGLKGAKTDSQIATEYARISVCAVFLYVRAAENPALESAEAMARQIDQVAESFSFERSIQLERAKAWRMIAWFHATRDDGSGQERAEELAKYVDTIAQPFPTDADFAIERVQVWRVTTFSYANDTGRRDAARARELAGRVDMIAAAFAEDRVFRIQRLWTWQYCLDASRTIEEADGVTAGIERIAAAFGDDREMVAGRLRTWERMAWWSANDGRAERAREIAEFADALAAPFAGEASIELSLLRIWRHATYAHHLQFKGNASRVQPFVDHADAIASRFPGDEDFVYEQVTVWALLSIAYSWAPEGGGAERAAQIAEYVDTLTHPFQSLVRFAHRRTEVWRLVILAFSEIEYGVGATRAMELAVHVDSIAAPFLGERDFLFAQAESWRHVASAWSKTGDAQRTRDAVARLDALADALPDDLGIQIERFNAAKQLCTAYGQSGIPERAARVAERLEQLAGRFSGDPDIDLWVVFAWVAVGWGYARLPGGEGAQDVEAVMEHVDALARRFPEARDFELERIRAVRNAVYAHAEKDRGHGLGRAMELASVVDSLAAPFAGDRAFAVARIEAWSFVVRAGSKRPGTGLGRMPQVLLEIDGIALPFSGDREVELVRVRAWREAILGYWVVSLPLADFGPRAEDLANRIDAIVAPFAGDLAFERERSISWRYVAGAYLRMPAFTKRVEELAMFVDECAAAFPGDVELERERAEVWGYAARKYAEDPADLSAERARRCAALVDALAARHAGHPDFESARTRAWHAVSGEITPLWSSRGRSRPR